MSNYIWLNVNARIVVRLLKDGQIYLQARYRKEYKQNWNDYHMESLWSFFYEFADITENIDIFMEKEFKVTDKDIFGNEKTYKLNVESNVLFKLTDFGKSKYPQLLKYMDKSNNIEMTLSSFIETTGSSFFNGGSVILVNNEIGLELKGL